MKFRSVKVLASILKRSIRYFKNEDLYLEAMALGMNSFVDLEKDEHMLFVDYDISEYGKVKESIKDMQQFFSLSHAFIYETNKGFHAFFFYDNNLPYSRIIMILNYAKYVDPLFKHISKFYDHKTIRVAGKYKFQDIKYHSMVKGRKPTKDEIAVADVKRQEYSMLKNMHQMFQKGKLRDNK